MVPIIWAFLLQGFLYVRTCKSDNEYAHPLDMCPLVDLNLGKVIHIDMYDEPARMPPMMVNYHRDLAKATTGKASSTSQNWAAYGRVIDVILEHLLLQQLMIGHFRI